MHRGQHKGHSPQCTRKAGKIGLDIPDGMPVYREEVYLRIKEQNRQASETLDTDFLMATELWKSKKK